MLPIFCPQDENQQEPTGALPTPVAGPPVLPTGLQPTTAVAVVIICAWCGKKMGTKNMVPPPGREDHPTHSICPKCQKKHFPDGE